MPIPNCVECPLLKYKNKIELPLYKKGRPVGKVTSKEVGFRGCKTAPIVAVGDMPSPIDIEQNKIFVGDVGSLLTDEFTKNGVSTGNFFYVNVLRCHIPKEQLTSAEEKKAVACCFPAADAVIKILKPKLILAFGNVAMQALSKLSGITKKRGVPVMLPSYDCLMFPLYHPSYCLRDQENLVMWKPDVEYISNYIRQGFKQNFVGTPTTDKYVEVDSIQSILDMSRPLTTGFDTETQGNMWMNKNFLLLAYSISVAEGQGCTVRLYEETKNKEEAGGELLWNRAGTKKNPTGVVVYYKKLPFFDRKMAELKKFAEDETIRKIMVSGTYDKHVLEREKIQLNGYVLDVLVGMHTTNPDVFSNVGLEEIQRVLRPTSFNHKATFAKEANKSDMLAAKPENLVKYASGDAVETRMCGLLAAKQIHRYSKLERYYQKFVHPITTDVLYEIEKNGVLFDTEKCPIVREELAKLLKSKVLSCLQKAPKDILKKHYNEDKALSLTRSQLVADILFSRQGFGLSPASLTKSGALSTDIKGLKRLRDDLEDDHPAREFLSEYFEWGPYNKLYTTYVKGFMEAVCDDGRLHPSLTVTTTATGRTSSRRPNLQNIPKRNKEIAKIIRSLIICPPGKKLVGIDYSQSELRWVAHRSGEPRLMEIYSTVGGDVHVTTAIKIVELGGKQWRYLSDIERADYRQKAKAVNFGFVFGMYPKGFMNYARDEYGVIVTLDEATSFRNEYFSPRLYYGLEGWHKKEIAFAQKNGYCISDYGRMRWTPNINSTDNRVRILDEHIAINTPIQSPSSDSALLGAYEARRSTGFDWSHAKLVCFIHDELIYEVDEGYEQELYQHVHYHLTHLPTERFGFTLRVPLDTEATISIDNNLGNMEGLKL